MDPSMCIPLPPPQKKNTNHPKVHPAQCACARRVQSHHSKPLVWPFKTSAKSKLHPWNLTQPLTIANPKRKLIFQPSFFRGYVKFRGSPGTSDGDLFGMEKITRPEFKGWKRWPPVTISMSRRLKNHIGRTFPKHFQGPSLLVQEG